MGIATWWYGPASTTHAPPSDVVPESSAQFGGQTLLLSHYQEIHDDFMSVCDEVRLYRSHAEHGFPRDGDAAGLVPEPDDADQAVLEALTLVGYIDGVQWPVIHFEFGSKRPGVLSWSPSSVSGPDSDLGYELLRKATSLASGAPGESLPPGYEEAASTRQEDVSGRLSRAYLAAKRRVLEAGHGRSTPWRRWAQLAGVGIWSVAAGLLAWLTLGSHAPLPALLIAAIALATSARTAQVRVHQHLQAHHMHTWKRGPVRLRWTSRAAVRQARANSRRDIWVGFIGTLIGAALAWLAWLVQQ